MTELGAVLEVMLHQRACRAYRPEPIPDDDLHRMLEAATHAPSAENRQPWVFVVVRDGDERSAIVDLTRAVWLGGARAHAEASLAPRFLQDVDEFVATGYGGAPVLVVAAGDGRGDTPPTVLASSVYPAVQNLLLAAAALGYGSSMTTLAAQAPDALATIVGLPVGIRPFAVVPLGRPAAPLGPPRRRPVSAVAHVDRFGVPFTDRRLEPGEPPPPAPPPV